MYIHAIYCSVHEFIHATYNYYYYYIIIIIVILYYYIYITSAS